MTYRGNSRRNFLKALTTTTLISGSSLSAFAGKADENQGDSHPENATKGTGESQNDLPIYHDGPASSLFDPLDFSGNLERSGINSTLVSETMAEAIKSAPSGKAVAWGIPFRIPEQVVVLKKEPCKISFSPHTGNWIIFLHTSDHGNLIKNPDGFYEKPFRGNGLLNEDAASYVVIYEDGREVSLPVRQRYHVGMFQQGWGENCIESVAHHKPMPISLEGEITNETWGWVQTRVSTEDRGNWINWIWAWENPNPEKKITGFRFEPSGNTPLILSAITFGKVRSNPLRWNKRQKAVLSLPKGSVFNPVPDKNGQLTGIRLDLGQVISATPRLNYPEQDWPQSYNNKIPLKPENEIIVEYTAHPDARFHLFDLDPIPVSNLIAGQNSQQIRAIKSARQVVKIRVIEKSSGKPVPVKFHAHGEAGEYLAPVDRHRQPNIAWFEDYSADYVNQGTHKCTYIQGETTINLPHGKVYLEVSKGFEIAPVRKVIDVSPETEVITLEIEKALHWREKGWVSADTHVHFLSPSTALLEGSAEGVNIINLLASQWGELMTNVGDFDGKTTFGSKSSGGDGEYIVRVGTENRQHVMGHISLLGYQGNIIAPMTTGGPDEAALGDPIEILLTEWAMQCKKQNGIVILPHFPNPRLENAASIISGGIDGVEMTSWENLYEGIDPYSLTDWYRYLNCGYFVAAVGGTDKMTAATAVGTVRTYAKIADNQEFTYDEWKESIRHGHTFVSYGPLLEFSVEGKPAGSEISMAANGGIVNIGWEAASVTIPMSRVELIVNGEVKESVAVSDWNGKGNWSYKVTRSSWIALLVRGHYPDKPEIIVAHTSPVMIRVKDSVMLAAADAMTILDQIEGAMAYLDTIGTRAEDEVYKRMKLVLTSAHRTIHNRMHEMGTFHKHIPVNDHPEHGKP
jgi:hypothetical protein